MEAPLLESECAAGRHPRGLIRDADREVVEAGSGLCGRLAHPNPLQLSCMLAVRPQRAAALVNSISRQPRISSGQQRPRRHGPGRVLLHGAVEVWWMQCGRAVAKPVRSCCGAARTVRCGAGCAGKCLQSHCGALIAGFDVDLGGEVAHHRDSTTAVAEIAWVRPAAVVVDHDLHDLAVEARVQPDDRVVVIGRVGMLGDIGQGLVRSEAEVVDHRGRGADGSQPLFELQPKLSGSVRTRLGGEGQTVVLIDGDDPSSGRMCGRRMRRQMGLPASSPGKPTVRRRPTLTSAGVEKARRHEPPMCPAHPPTEL